jgi:hypothetical protein
MGLTASAPLVSPPAKGIIDPSTGKPVGANDKIFGELNSELADKRLFGHRDRRSHHVGPHRLNERRTLEWIDPPRRWLGPR